MASHKMERIGEDIRRELAGLIASMKDPRMTGVISVVRANVTNDLSYAKVYISSLDGAEATEEAVKVLKKAAGYLRSEISSRMHIRKSPELIFIADDSMAYGARIEGILEELGVEKD